METAVKKRYKCSICGKEYETAGARANCEIECDRKERKKQEEDYHRKLREQKESRRSEISSMYKELQSKINTYEKDYNEHPLNIDKYRVSAAYAPFLSLLGL